MFKFITAAIVSTLMVVTPAAAQDTERRQLNEGAIAALLIGGAAIWALSKNNDKKKEANVHKNRNDDVFRHTHNGSSHWHHRNERGSQAHGQKDRYKAKHNKRVLPSTCVRTAENGNRDFRYVGARCLKRQNYTRRLPTSCGVFQTRDGTPRAYGVRCLREAGYRFEARR